MNKRILVLLSLLTALVCLATFCFSVYATNEVPTTAPAPVETEPPAPIETEAPVVTPTDSGIVDDGTGDDYYTEETYETEYLPVETTAPDNYVDSYTNEDGYYYYDEDQMVNSLEDTAGNVSDYTTLYDTSNINRAELEESKWDNISLSISDKNSDGSFAAIKDNEGDGDDGQWIIYTGLILIGLSVIGIMYFIIATSTYKKKLKALRAREMRHRERHRERSADDYGDLSEYPTQSDYNKRYQRNRYTSSSLSYTERKRLNKADTAEIDISTRYTARH